MAPKIEATHPLPRGGTDLMTRELIDGDPKAIAGFKAMAVGTFVAADGSVFLTQVFITR